MILLTMRTWPYIKLILLILKRIILILNSFVQPKSFGSIVTTEKLRAVIRIVISRLAMTTHIGAVLGVVAAFTATGAVGWAAVCFVVL